MGKFRIDRISEEVRKELSEIIRDEIRDPRIHLMTSLVSVVVAPDLKIAKVRVSVLGNEEEKTNTIKGLKAGAGYMRRLLGERMQLRYTPELIFEIDSSIEYGAHINQLLHDLNIDKGKNDEI